MTKFVRFRHLSNGHVASYPEHYEKHPVFGFDLVRVTPNDEAPVEPELEVVEAEVADDEDVDNTTIKKTTRKH